MPTATLSAAACLIVSYQAFSDTYNSPCSMASNKPRDPWCRLLEQIFGRHPKGLGESIDNQHAVRLLVS
jgi:hypothetical protein